MTDEEWWMEQAKENGCSSKEELLRNADKQIAKFIKKHSVSKKTKREVCRKILQRPVGHVLNEKDLRMMTKLVFQYHPNWEEKKKGMHHIEIGVSDRGSICFFIIYQDGRRDEIGTNKCLDNSNYRIKVINEACRQAVVKTVMKVRYSITLPYKCPITGEIINSLDDIDIDHYDLTFDELFKLWIKDKDLDELYEKVEKRPGKKYFRDVETYDEFVEFHNSHTHLRAVSVKANRSILRKKVINN